MDSARVGNFRVMGSIALMRPHQWIKNGFVLLGLVFAHRWSDPRLVLSVMMAFAAFCAAASSVYVYNDLMDVVSDSEHFHKRHRPIASGLIPISTAQALCAVLALLAITLAALVSAATVALVASYAVMNIAYSHRLKHIVIVDVCVISAGFMLRILVGTIGVGIAPSAWLLLCGMTLTLFMGFGKRRAELMVSEDSGRSTRRVLMQYDLPLLDQFLAMTAACAVLSYSMYTMSPDTIRLHGTDKLSYTVPFIVYGIFRYLYLLNRFGKGQDTARDLVTDKHLLATCVGWLIAVVAILR